ncbi:MAG: flavin reductase family protein [Chloroflexi bacterium]|nr:flavin reductase family protein [Chloroflexota bacterium]
MEYGDIAPIMGRLWSPLAAVTSQWGGKVNAQIAVAISAASIVPERPRVLVQIYKGNYSHRLIARSGAFALNFITSEQLHLIRDFGLVSGIDRDKMVGVEHSIGITGTPLLAGCAGFLECQVINAMDGGDMTCFLADVVNGYSDREILPISWRDARRLIPQEWNDAWNSKIAREIDISLDQMDRIDFSPWTPFAGK